MTELRQSDVLMRILDRQDQQIDAIARLEVSVKELKDSIGPFGDMDRRVTILETESSGDTRRRDKVVAWVSAGVASISAAFSLASHFTRWPG